MPSTQLRDLLLLVIGSLVAAQGAFNVKPYNVEQACNDLGSSRNNTLSWTYADCVDVWTRFTEGFDKSAMRKSSAIGIWKKTADELRRNGSPCLLVGSPPNDGMGSTTIRIMYAWIFAEEMGCDWVTPDWGESRAGLGSGEVKYCHPVVPKEIWKKLSREDMKPYSRCTTVDLLEFFNFRVSSFDVPEGGTNMLQLDRLTNPKDLVLFRNEFWAEGSTNKMNLLRNRVLISVGLSVTTASLASIGSWDTDRIRTVHNVLQQARDNFNKFPRPSFNVEPQCGFDPTRLNIAIHVRMGDRRVAPEEEVKYFKRLEEFMASVTDVVVEQGLQPPMFRIFTETTLPCPDSETGLFEELPLWPVKLDQAQACHDIKTPDDCPDYSRVQGVCIPERDGIFYVQDKPMVLHLNPDIRNALSCMIKADGIVMGCSTFGQIAGILSQGISFFSLGCDGDMTGAKSKMTPGLAVADKGYRWVPVNGSWLDPALYSTDILRATVEEFTVNKYKS